MAVLWAAGSCLNPSAVCMRWPLPLVQLSHNIAVIHPPPPRPTPTHPSRSRGSFLALRMLLGIAEVGQSSGACAWHAEGGSQSRAPSRAGIGRALTCTQAAGHGSFFVAFHLHGPLRFIPWIAAGWSPARHVAVYQVSFWMLHLRRHGSQQSHPCLLYEVGMDQRTNMSCRPPSCPTPLPTTVRHAAASFTCPPASRYQ